MPSLITTLLVVLIGGVGALLWRSFLPSYFSEKAKNLATREDVAGITKQIEDVKALYSAQLKEIEHQNALVLEQLRGQQQLRLAAVERRLHAHQEAFALWRKLVANAHSQNVQPLVIECQSWWEQNCLYLSAAARDSFNAAYFAASSHHQLTRNPVDSALMKENWQTLQRAGEDIVAGVDLPPLGQRESENAPSATNTPDPSQ